MIIPCLDSNHIEYKVLTKDEIDGLIRTTRMYDTSNTIEDNEVEKEEEKEVDKVEEEELEEEKEEYIVIPTSLLRQRPTAELTPRDYQEIIIDKSVAHFQTQDKGLLIIPCGVGKTLISLWIAQKLDTKTILIGVPNKLLLKQWTDIISVLFLGIPCLTVSSGITVEKIIRFLEKNRHQCIVLTTYASAHKVYMATRHTMHTFCMKLNDEAHHLTTKNMQVEHTAKKYIQMLHISSEKQLSLTATVKLLEDLEEGEGEKEKEKVVSNDNVAHFGEIIERQGLLWAINQQIICDYVIQTIVTNEEQLEQQLSHFHITEENDKRLFLSAYASLKSIFDGHSHHLLIYTNNRDNSQLLIRIIAKLLEYHHFDTPELYYSSYHSEMRPKEQHDIKKNFNKAPFGIITCVYCLAEGYDNPNIDAVVFAENMSSEIRIVQSALRASRKNKWEPNKLTKIILPILIKEDWLDNNNNPDLQKVKVVIYQMGLEDETISQKIKACRMNVELCASSKPKENKSSATRLAEFGDYDDELTQQIRLNTHKRTSLGISYEKAKKILADKNLQSKESYYELCEKNNRLPREPEIVFKTKFDWIDYLHIDRTKYYDLASCKTNIKKYLSLHPELNTNYLDLFIVCTKLCELDEQFPPNKLWCEFYRVTNLTEIIVIVVGNNKKKQGAC